MDTYSDTDQAKTDIEQIHNLLGTYVETWNSHDMDAWGSLFTDDVDYVNQNSAWWQSNEQNVDGQRAIHNTLIERSQPMDYMAMVAKISFLTPEIVLAHVTWEWPGFVLPEGDTAEGLSGTITMVLVKRDGAWLIRALQNTVAG